MRYCTGEGSLLLKLLKMKRRTLRIPKQCSNRNSWIVSAFVFSSWVSILFIQETETLENAAKDCSGVEAAGRKEGEAVLGFHSVLSSRAGGLKLNLILGSRPWQCPWWWLSAQIVLLWSLLFLPPCHVQAACCFCWPGSWCQELNFLVLLFP